MFWLLLGACGSNGNSSVDPCYQHEPIISIGSGETSFVPLATEEPVTMIHGPQGGWHILGSIQLEHTRDIVEVTFEIYDEESGVLISDNQYRVGLIMEEECAGYYPGMYGYLNMEGLATGEETTPPQLLQDHVLRMYMRSNDCTESQQAQGECVRAERWAEETHYVRAALDPIDVVD